MNRCPECPPYASPCEACGRRDARRTVIHAAEPVTAEEADRYIPRFARVDANDPEADIPQ